MGDVFKIIELIANLLIVTVQVAELASNVHSAHKANARVRESRDQLMAELLGEDWQVRVPLDFFATHTICRCCNRFFDTTDPKDKCKASGRGLHTYTKALDDAVRRAVAKSHGRAPPLFLPGGKKASSALVQPPAPIESDWLLMDSEKDGPTAAAAAAASSSSVANDDDDENEDENDDLAEAERNYSHVHAPPSALLLPPAYNSSELRELEIDPEGASAHPVSDERARASYQQLISSLPPEIRELAFPAPPAGDPEPHIIDQAPHPPQFDPNDPRTVPPPAYSSAASPLF